MTLSSFDLASLLWVAGASCYVLGRWFSSRTVNETNTNTDVTVNLPDDAKTLAALDLDDPAVREAQSGNLFRARVWLSVYKAAADNSDDYPEDIADQAVKAICQR